MTQITGKEPPHWHKEDSNGVVRHNMTDPRTLGLPLNQLSPDERDYVKHLEDHQAQLSWSQPLKTDPEVLHPVLAYIANEQRKVEALREVVAIIRQEVAAGVPLKDSQGIALLRKVWPSEPDEQSDTDRPAGSPQEGTER